MKSYSELMFDNRYDLGVTCVSPPDINNTPIIVPFSVSVFAVVADKVDTPK